MKENNKKIEDNKKTFPYDEEPNIEKKTMDLKGMPPTKAYLPQPPWSFKNTIDLKLSHQREAAFIRPRASTVDGVLGFGALNGKQNLEADKKMDKLDLIKD